MRFQFNREEILN